MCECVCRTLQQARHSCVNVSVVRFARNVVAVGARDGRRGRRPRRVVLADGAHQLAQPVPVRRRARGHAVGAHRRALRHQVHPELTFIQLGRQSVRHLMVTDYRRLREEDA